MNVQKEHAETIPATTIWAATNVHAERGFYTQLLQMAQFLAKVNNVVTSTFLNSVAKFYRSYG